MTVVLTAAGDLRAERAALVGSGATRANADPVARSIQDAEAEGFPNGGLSYLLHYCQHLRSGRVDGRAVPIVRVAGAVASSRSTPPMASATPPSRRPRISSSR